MCLCPCEVTSGGDCVCMCVSVCVCVCVSICVWVCVCECECVSVCVWVSVMSLCPCEVTGGDEKVKYMLHICANNPGLQFRFICARLLISYENISPPTKKHLLTNFLFSLTKKNLPYRND